MFGSNRDEHSVIVFVAVAFLVLGSLVIASKIAAGEERPAQGAHPLASLSMATFESPAAATVEPTAEAPATVDEAEVAPSPEAAIAVEGGLVTEEAAAVFQETTPVEEATPIEEAATVEETAAPVEEPAPAIEAPLPPSPPGVDATAFAVVDVPCGYLHFAHNGGESLAPASLTKIMTALVVVENVDDLHEMVSVTVSGSAMAKRGSSVMGIEPGMRLSVLDLLYGLFLPSGNDAALALAQHVGGGDVGRFVHMMNARAASLGMNATHFANPHGLDAAGHHSSVVDMTIVGRVFMEHPLLHAISTTREYRPTWNRGVLKNGNKLLASYSGAYGVKIGYTGQAKQTIVAAAERDGRQIMVSVFGSSNRYQASAALLDWAFANTTNLCTSG